MKFSFTIIIIIITTLLLSAQFSAQAASSSSSSSSFTPRDSHQYCVVGAGAAGVQIAYLMNRYQNPKMDYVVLERNSRPGSFFETYPRQRKLISINKVYTGTNDQEFNLRHDWNSLLNHDDDFFFSAKNGEKEIENRTVLFKEIAREYYPSADTIPKYLELFVQEHGPFNIAFDTDVVSIKQEQEQQNQMKKKKKKKKFILKLSTGKSLQCEVVILASGKSVERKPRLKTGTNLITFYSDAPTSPNKYTDQALLIIGGGNSAFELARATTDYTALVHIATRNPVDFAHQSHYVGSVRAVNLGFLDRYQLKSNDVLIGLPHDDFSKLELYRDKVTGKIKFKMSIVDVDEIEKQQQKEQKDKQRQQLDSQFPFLPKGHRDHLLGESESDENSKKKKKQKEEEEKAEEERERQRKNKEKNQQEQGGGDDDVDEEREQRELDEFAAKANAEIFPSRRGYDRVVVCLGFRLNNSMFQNNNNNHQDEKSNNKNNNKNKNQKKKKKKKDCVISSASSTSESCELEDEEEETIVPTTTTTTTKTTPIQPLLDTTKSFFEIASNYESVNIENLFVAGALAHFRDFKRSAGGFIHGFRYTARTLVASLRERFQNVEFSFLEFTGKTQVLSRIMWRLKNVSSLYQMQSQLCDAVVIIIEEKGDGKGEKIKKKYRYYQDLPVDNLKSKTPILTSLAPSAFSKTNLHFLTLSLEFGKDFQGVGTLHHQAQKETYSRTASKMLWNSAPGAPLLSDPDFRLTHSRTTGGKPLPKLDRLSANDLMKKDEAKLTRYENSTIDVLNLLHPLQDPPNLLHASVEKLKNGKKIKRPPRLDRFLFLHPVLREWNRTPISSSSSSSSSTNVVKNQLVRELRLHEDVLNDFSESFIHHQDPVGRFLDRVL